MQFPHIKDDKFPNVSNVDVWKFQNDFDYARWQGKVSIKLTNVLWNSNYADVPGFENDEKRDKWFDEQDGLVHTLESAFNVTPDNSVRIPVPYNDAYRFNYLIVDMPIQTSASEPLDYEFEATRVKRWYYFIDSMQQHSPNTTTLYVTLDVWTTFSHTVDIPYMMLERGHAPMMQTTVDAYLANPLMNNEYLLADDFNYGNDTIIQTMNYKPIGNGEKYVLFCAPYSKEDFDDFGGGNWGESTAPTYANGSGRSDYQIIVNDYAWGFGDVDYAGAKLPIHNQIESGVLNGCACYAIAGSEAREFFNDCAKYYVNFIHGIQAMFILDADLFTIDSSFTFANHTLYAVSQKHVADEFNFTKEQFGFDNKYSEITKLYTFPYSELEITDDEGNSFTAKIENCGNVKMHKEISLVYPFLNYNVFFSGINGDLEAEYIWKKVQGTDSTREMWASDFSKFMMNWEIPTYAIYVSSESEYAANNYYGMQAKRAGAIKDYQNAVRYGNTNYENTKDTMIMVKDNADATAECNRQNNEDYADVSKINTTTATQTATKITTEIHNPKILAANDATTEKLAADVNVANSTATVITGANNDYTMISNGASAGAGVASAIVGGIGGAASFTSEEGVSVIGSLVHINQALISCTAQGITTTQAVSTNQAALNANKDANNAYYLNTRTLNNLINGSDSFGVAGLIPQENAQTTQAQNTCATRQADNNVAVVEGGTASAISGNSHSFGGTAPRTESMVKANATRQKNTETNNANYTRNATITAEKANLVQKQLDAESQYKNARLQKPTTYSNYSGDFMPDAYQRRGVRMNIRTQTRAAIAQAGDAFLRYGYALHRVWDMADGWHYGKHFTFWKAEDIWINEGSGLSGNAVNIIGEILKKGVTVWRNPNEIGKVSIYDNI